MYKTIIGLEIHAQLQTTSKAFCRCANHSQSSPNTNCCPICTGQPGSLPSLNKTMVELALKASIAFQCDVNHTTSFDRKNYFSHDMPKNYQITQFFQPIGKNGFLEILTEERKKKITISSVHMEEDSARTLNRKENDHEGQVTLLDYNRSGIPLLEIVTAPEITSPQEAVDCFEAIRMILLYLNVCDGHMEAGSLRCDANISLQNTETNESTGRVEIKNLNTFKNLERALCFEEKQLKESFGSFNDNQAVTKDWYEGSKRTKVSRDKETIKDYRYFKEPDLPVVLISEEQVQTVQNQIPELPLNRLERLINDYDLRFDIAKSLVADQALADFFEQAMSISKTVDMKHTIIRDVKSYLNHSGKIITETQLTPGKLDHLLQSVKNGRIAPMMKQRILEKLFETPKTVDTIIEEENLIKIDDKDSLKDILEEIITENEEQYEAYICGKTELFKWFIGQMIKRTKGRADPKQIISIIKERMGD